MIKFTIEDLSLEDYMTLLQTKEHPEMAKQYTLSVGCEIINTTAVNNAFVDTALVVNFFINITQNVACGMIAAYLYDTIKGHRIKINDEPVKNDVETIEEKLKAGDSNG